MREGHQDQRYSGVLTRLRGDVRGTTLAMMAAAMIPTIVIAGSAIDVARMYVVKVRLQQACDAGVLAGRKFLADSNATAMDTNAETQAKKFFDNNFKAGWMGTTAVSFAPSKTADKQVGGVANATVPMTIMATFGQTQKTITQTCEARYDVADADIMFVLDTTGSMACLPSDNVSTCNAYAVNSANVTSPGGIRQVTKKTGSRIEGLKDAMEDFYTTLKSNAQPTTKFRFGYVPYNSTVNVGKIISRSYIVDTWHYPSRWVIADAAKGAAVNDADVTNVTSAACDALVVRNPATPLTYFTSGANKGRAQQKVKVSYTANTAPADVTKGTCKLKTQLVMPKWRYGNLANVDVSSYANGNTVTNFAMADGTTSSWDGCIEERDTTSDDSFNINSLPADLDPDLVPSSNNTKWRPMWINAVFDRTATPEDLNDDDPRTYANRYSPNLDAEDYNAIGCPREAKRLAEVTSLSDVQNYLNDSHFVPYGTTYHDIGMTWGLRFLSPTGPFASDTASWPGHQPPNRYIVFMSDGDMTPNSYVYGSHGFEKLEPRVTDDGSTNILARHNARFLALCSAAKARNIRIFVVAFGLTATTEMNTCASANSVYSASDTTGLQNAFKKIAEQVAQLRLSK